MFLYSAAQISIPLNTFYSFKYAVKASSDYDPRIDRSIIIDNTNLASLNWLGQLNQFSPKESSFIIQVIFYVTN